MTTAIDIVTEHFGDEVLQPYREGLQREKEAKARTPGMPSSSLPMCSSGGSPLTLLPAQAREQYLRQGRSRSTLPLLRSSSSEQPVLSPPGTMPWWVPRGAHASPSHVCVALLAPACYAPSRAISRATASGAPPSTARGRGVSRARSPNGTGTLWCVPPCRTPPNGTGTLWCVPPCRTPPTSPAPDIPPHSHTLCSMHHIHT